MVIASTLVELSDQRTVSEDRFESIDQDRRAKKINSARSNRPQIPMINLAFRLVGSTINHPGVDPLPAIFPDRGRIAPDIAPGFPRPLTCGYAQVVQSTR